MFYLGMDIVFRFGQFRENLDIGLKNKIAL